MLCLEFWIEKNSGKVGYKINEGLGYMVFKCYFKRVVFCVEVGKLFRGLGLKILI